MKYLIFTKTLILGLVLQMFLVSSMMASSHREAPLISSDPLADNTDLYAFRSPDNPDMITVIATYVPLQLPHGGPNYYTFGENVRYEIHVDNDASRPGDEIIYRFTFNIENEDPTTFFNIRLGKQNQKATYTLERSMNGGQSFQKIVTNGYVPPNNIGPRSIESPVGLNTSYASLFQKGITSSSTGETVFAGPTDDPFFVDLGGIFDLGDAPRQMGKPVDGLACYNVSAIAIQIPISTLLKQGAPSTPANILDPNYVIGVWASASRPSLTTLSSTGDPEVSGDWVQVSRLGMPLTNEAVIAIGDKDYWNSLSPYDEISDTTLDEYFYNPELALYMDDDQFGGAVPAFSDLRIQTNSLGSFDFTNGANGLYGLKGDPALDGTALDDDVFGTLLLPAAGKPRSVDLWPAFHTGVPNVIPYQLATGKGGNPLAAGKPFVNNFLPNGGDMLRLNMAVPVTQRDDPFFSSLGLIQAAAIGLTVAPFNDSSNLEFLPNMDGFPNGRRLEDDVTRIELQAVGGVVLAAVGLWYDDYDPNSSPSPVTEDLLNVLSYTTGVESNDKPFRSEFPYLAMPFRGTGECGGEIFRGDPAEEDLLASKYFVSSNTQNNIAILDVFDDKVVEDSRWANRAEDADGIYYDKEDDVLYQLNRTDNVIDLYANVVANMQMGMAPEYVMSSTSDFVNGRGISVSNGKLVVAQDANDANNQTNKFVIYNVSPTSIEFDRALTVDKNLWGVELDGNTLYAIEDNSWNLMIFNNLSRKDGQVSPDRTIIIQDMVRTHGLSYDSESDVMILTDIGDAGSATDGAIVVVSNWTDAIKNRYLTDDEQARIEGPNSSLGNPVDVAYDRELNVVLVAERASEGGKVLAFEMPMTSGDASPFYTLKYAGASSIGGSDVDAQEVVEPMAIADFFASSNTTGMAGYGQVFEDSSLSISTFNVDGMDADGIFYDESADVLYQLNRTDNVINAYSKVKENLANGENPELTATSTSDFINGREITVTGDRLIVAQDANDANGQQNRLIVYEISPTAIEFKQAYDVNINLWGIHADVNSLYAIVDNSNGLAMFDNFFLNTDDEIAPTRTVLVENIVRTHGLSYDANQDVMVMTDVGDGAVDDDGAIIYIPNFIAAASDNMISADEQSRISGASTSLGNPVDIAFDAEANMIYVAERANAGGQILAFETPDSSGNVMPVVSSLFDGASAIHISGSARPGDPSTQSLAKTKQSMVDVLYPNPTASEINVDFSEVVDFSEDQVVEMEIISMTGAVVATKSATSSNMTWDVSGLKAGVYFIHMKTLRGSQQLKFFKL